MGRKKHKKPVIWRLAIFSICTVIILAFSIISDNIKTTHREVTVSKDVNSNSDCDQTLYQNTDTSINVGAGNHIANCVSDSTSNNKKIVCWGDSITYGLGGQDNTYIVREDEVIDASNWNYPDTLKYYTGMDVYNLGVCGETSYDIAIRQGGIKMYIEKQVTVKPGKKVQVSIIDEFGGKVTLENFSGYESYNEAPENVVYINDIAFQLETDNGKLYISIYNNSSGKSVKLKKGSQVVTKAAHDIAGDVIVIQMGSNGGWDDYDELIQQYKSMIANSGTECYIIIGDTDNPDESIEGDYYIDNPEAGLEETLWEAALREAFGEHFINMRMYMLENALDVTSLEPDTEDEESLLQGRVPESLKYDYTHLNSYGYYTVGVAVYEKGIELGYW